jgi:hypothetical protein
VLATVVAIAVLVARELPIAVAVVAKTGHLTIFASWALIVGGKILLAESFGAVARRSDVLMSWAERQSVHHRAELAKYLPGIVLQFASKGYLLINKGAAVTVATRIVAVEQAWLFGGAFVSTVLLTGLSFGVGGLLPRAPWATSMMLTVLGLAMVILFALLTVRGLRVRLIAQLPRSIDVARLLVGWLLYSAAFGAIGAAAIGESASSTALVTLLAAFPAAWIVGYLTPFAPAGLGVREGMLVVLTIPVLGLQTATGLAILSRVVYVLAEAALALAFFNHHARPVHEGRKGN